ncbi:attachment protein [Pseudomonas nitroreducens]|uniref:attachment protein n=1 Tax=Pseudomonas nitroreducens TaxID=46680 RepID=UPI001FB5DFFA|nr:attachment protein [Pseudomonas nitroreducens]MCJ1879354.1 attachment protein [Pseudomonas nitroreducens]MCJ1896649.1 attachment protein [Pseudomonas nitroreducens]
MNRFLRGLLWCLPALLLPQFAQAALHYFQYGSDRYSSAGAVCEAYRAQNQKNTSSPLEVIVTMTNPATVKCQLKYTNGGFSGSTTFGRMGDSCGTGATWSGTNGQCECPAGQQQDASGSCAVPPTCEVGMPLLTRGPDSPTTTIAGRVTILSTPPSSVCSGSCQYQLNSSKATSCYLVPGSTSQGFCNYSMSSDGQNCATDNALPPSVGDSPNPAPPEGETDPNTPPSDPNDPGCPDGYSWSGTTCVKSPTDPGTDPGEGGGTDPGTGGGNGGGDGGGTDPGTGGGNGGGTDPGTGGGDGSGNGNGNGSGNGDGEGEGEGQCDPAKDPNGCQGNGPSSELSEPKAGNWDEANKEWDQKVQEAKKDLKDAVKANIDQLKGSFDLQLSTGGGQLPCDSFTVWGKSYRLCVADYSTQLSYMRLALLLMAALIAAFVILKD